jgi:hypothetical protein
MSSDVEAAERRLYVSWRHPSGLVVPVGLLIQRSSGPTTRFEFTYLKRAERTDEFEPLPGFPLLDRRYSADRLFPVFANRVMPRDRPDYGRFVEELDLRVEADPFEVLGRSSGIRATDRIEVFPAPERDATGHLNTLFFARGLRYLADAPGAVELLEPGDRLVLVDDRTNPINPLALHLRAPSQAIVGWAPDYLVDTIRELQHLNGVDPGVSVEHRNQPISPPHLRLLCRLRAPWPSGYQPFSGPDFQPIVGD